MPKIHRARSRRTAALAIFSFVPILQNIRYDARVHFVAFWAIQDHISMLTCLELCGAVLNFGLSELDSSISIERLIRQWTSLVSALKMKERQHAVAVCYELLSRISRIN